MENRQAFLNSPLQVRPIIGYHCWALGFLDSRGSTAGCLLHPARNGGEDLRELVDYGSKCRRESCRAARIYEKLPLEGQVFWLELVRGLNPFYYSSQRANPLFHLLPWGAELLERLRKYAVSLDWTVTELLYRCPFLMRRTWKPQAHRLLFKLLLDQWETKDGWIDWIEELAGQLLGEIPGLKAIQALKSSAEEEEAVWIHLAPGPERSELLDFFRLELSVRKATLTRIEEAGAAVPALAAKIQDLGR
jgi:hypothetical protein